MTGSLLEIGALANLADHLPNHGLQGACILERMALNVVVEVAPDATALPRLVDAPVGPLDQRLVGIAAPIFAAGAMEPHIGDPAACPAGWFQSLEIVHD